MGTEPKARRDERVREDVLAVVDAIKTGAEAVPAIVGAVPWVVVLSWTFYRLREPVRISDTSEVIVARLTLATTPYYVLLGMFFQGIQGAIVGGLSGLIDSLVATMSLKVVKKPDVAAEPFPGDAEYRQLGMADALYLASMLPMMLIVLSHQQVQTSRPVVTP